MGIVAVAAELAHVGYGPEIVLALKDVAEGAVTGRNRPMEKLFPYPSRRGTFRLRKKFSVLWNCHQQQKPISLQGGK